MTLSKRYSPTPDYGRGAYRRRIDLRVEPGSVRARLFDDFHDMNLALEHDGDRVTHMTGRISRAPFTTCPGAPAELKTIVGLALMTPRRLLYGAGRPQRNCTHLFDLAAFAVFCASAGPGDRVLDFVVTDLSPAGGLVEARVDGNVMHGWHVAHEESIQEPASYLGRSLFGGFSAWAEAQFQGFELELALHLQKVVFVARGRRYLLAATASGSIRDEPERVGACYTFSYPQFSDAEANSDYVRDLSDGIPESIRTPVRD
jgi:hypothetical protein